MNLIYIILIVLALIIAGFGWSERLKKINAPLSWFFIFIFAVLIGFRSSDSGVDTIAYYNYFYDIKYRITPYYTFESGFIFFTEFMTKITNVETYVFTLSFLQLLCIYLSAKRLNINNKLVAIVLYLSFIPGFDMLTNGLRSGLALSVGLLILVCTTIYSNRYVLLNMFPILMHTSYTIITIISFFTKRFSGYKMNYFIFISSITFFVLWLVVNPIIIVSFFENISSQASAFGRLGRIVRYLIIEKELMSFTVKLYFMILSLFFSFLYFYTSKKQANARNDEVLTRMAFLALSIQLVYALCSFSQYSYRFMFLAFPLQALMFCYIMDKYYSGVMRSIIVLAVCFLGVLSTYSTKTFSSFKLLNL